MLKVARCILFLLLLNLCLFCGCSSDTSYPVSNSFSAVVFSDIHFNPFYDPALFTALNSSSVELWPDIFKGSSMKSVSERGSDTNYPSLVMALSGIKKNVGSASLIIFAGDMLGHNLTETFYNKYGSRDVAAMQAFTDKIVAFIMNQIRLSVGNIPVMFAVGNSDSYSLIDDGPDSSFLAHTADYYYTKFLNSTVDQQEFLSTFTAGGYYSAEPAGTNLVVIGLNTVLFTSSLQSTLANNELTWLETKVAAAKAGGKKVWLLLHVPPGANIVEAANSVDVNGHSTTTPVSMMWDTTSNYQERFLNIFSTYPGVVTLTLAAHTHMDEFRIMTPSDVLEITPGITPYFGNNPAFKVFTFAKDSLNPTDYRSVYYNLDSMPDRFNDYYTFSQTYLMQGPSLNASLLLLSNTIDTNSSYKNAYASGYNSGNSSLIPVTYKPNGNPYTPVITVQSNNKPYMNWPVFSCGAKFITQTDFANCANSQ